MTLPLFLAFVLAALAAVLVMLIHEIRALRAQVGALALAQESMAALAAERREALESVAALREALWRAREIDAANDLVVVDEEEPPVRSTILPPRHDPRGRRRT